MSGVWVFKNGVFRLVENLGDEQGDGQGRFRRRRKLKVLVHVPTNEVMRSYEMLERKLNELGWVRYHGEFPLLQFHKPPSVHLISLPRDFSRLSTVHMYDIVVKSRNIFQVMDA